MKKISKAQIRKIHVLLSQIGMIEDKAGIMHQASNGRTSSTKELYMSEARKLIEQLTSLAGTKSKVNAIANYKPIDRLRFAIVSLAYKAGIIYGTSEADKVMNVAKLNMFIRERGSVKKELFEMDYKETLKTHRQFEAVYKNMQAAKEKKQADTAINNMLNELDIVVG